MIKVNSPIADIGIIGSGIACVSALIALFERLLACTEGLKLPIYITVIERYGEMWKGIPYGNRSSVNALTITTINDFFTNDTERGDFFKWFVINKKNLLEKYADMGGTVAANWLKDNEEELNNNGWNHIYLPRHIIGEYFLQRLNDLRAKAEAKSLVAVNIVQGDATAIKARRKYKGIVVNTGNGKYEVPVKKVVLAIGSAPAKKLTNVFDGQFKVLYINNLHDKNLEKAIADITERLSLTAAGEKNVLIIGSNAGSVELLYLLNNTLHLADNIDKITVLSHSGKLPGRITYNKYPHPVTANLDALAKQGSYTIEQLAEAAKQDILKVVAAEVSVPDVDRIMAQTIHMLGSLDDGAKKLFYAIYGVQLARIFRRSGTDYKNAAQTLTETKKLELIKGSYSTLEYNNDGTTTLAYVNSNKTLTRLTNTFKVIVNCTGSEDLVTGSSALITDLIKNNGVKVNPSGKAFVVNDKLEAAPDIYVTGPLAGGNFNKLLYFWHLENASRIIYLSKYLIKELL